MKIKLSMMIAFSIIAICGFIAKVEAKPKLAKANCFCKASWDLGSNPASINPAHIDWGQIKQYTGLNPQKEANQQDCRNVCESQAASDPRFTQEWWCANVIGENLKPYSGKMIAYSAVGTKNYRIALQKDVTCAKTTSTGGGTTTGGWQTAGFVATDAALKERCSRLSKADVQTKNSNPSLSQRLMQVRTAKNWNVVGYNSSDYDRIFLDSFRLGNCKVCYAEMTVRVSSLNGATGDGDGGNDALNILGIPDTTAPNFGYSPALQSFRIWQPPTSAPNMPASAGTSKTITFQVPANLLSEYIAKTSPNTPLDVLVQDDTAIQSMQLSVWYY